MTTREIIHILPASDGFPHEPENCLCRPSIHEGSEGLHFAHNPFTRPAGEWVIGREVEEDSDGQEG